MTYRERHDDPGRGWVDNERCASVAARHAAAALRPIGKGSWLVRRECQLAASHREKSGATWQQQNRDSRPESCEQDVLAREARQVGTQFRCRAQLVACRGPDQLHVARMGQDLLVCSIHTAICTSLAHMFDYCPAAGCRATVVR